METELERGVALWTMNDNNNNNNKYMSKTLNPSVSNLPETQSAIPASTFSAYSTKTRRAKEHGNEFLNLLFRLRTDLGAALSRLSLSAQEHDSGLWHVFVQRTLYV